MPTLNDTHDPARESLVASANRPGSDFPIQNLPYGIFSEADGRRRVGVAIGDRILDLTALESDGRLKPSPAAPVFDEGVLNPFMALPPAAWSETRARIADLLDARVRASDLPLFAMTGAKLHLPFFVRSFTDFYASKAHATNVGSMFRDPENALLPNWLHLPVGYNGRASTVVVSGTGVHRPNGQLKGPEDAVPRFGPSRRLDIELEIGAVVGTPNAMGQPINTGEAYNAIFGYVLVNDWSARDIQVWEYQPLGPFQAKAFATTISPWVVTREALEPYRVPPPPRVTPLLPYLQEDTPNAFDIALDIGLAGAGQEATIVSRTNYRHMYYTSAQQLTHHTSSGCAMETGDLLGSGTVSGEEPGSYGSLLELTWNGRAPVAVAGGTRVFLEDGDTVTLTGRCGTPDAGLGFGPCTGTILPAVAFGD